MTMKLNKSKNKGKVHPSPSSSSSPLSLSSTSTSTSTSTSASDPVSSLNLLLPAAILTLISVLSLQDREVLAYMITRSLKSADETATKRKKNKPRKSTPSHKSPSFDCECFECYTTYWFRWDSSPHRELIHQAIEAFEEHLASAERATTNSATKSRRRDKQKEKEKAPVEERHVDSSAPAVVEEADSEPSPESVAGVEETTAEEEEEASGGHKVEVEVETEVQREQQQKVEVETEVQREQQQHKGLARKVLPDVIGLFNSRLWNLWGPNM